MIQNNNRSMNDTWQTFNWIQNGTSLIN